MEDLFSEAKRCGRFSKTVLCPSTMAFANKQWPQQR
jgi:hypothetical protein